MNVLLWHVHGSWTTAFVQGRHRYIVPSDRRRSPDGLGRAVTWEWPDSVAEAPMESPCELEIDVAILQRPHELELIDRWLGHRPPLVYVEHDPPRRDGDRRHPFADRDDITIVHVTGFNRAAWHTGTTRTEVIEHGVPDPGLRWSGGRPVAVAAVNNPQQRPWETGLDLLDAVRRHVPVDLYGMGTEAIGGHDVPQQQLHREMATRRVYVHACRWTSLGLTLLEAMIMGMPAVAVAATEVPRVFPSGTVVMANDAHALVEGVTRMLNDLEAATERGATGRAFVEQRFSMERFLAEWDRLLERVVD